MSDLIAELPAGERAAAELAWRLRHEGLEPLLQLRLSDGYAQVTRAALHIIQELHGDLLGSLALDAASRLSP